MWKENRGILGPRTDERMGGWRATCFPPPPVHHPFSARYTVPSPPFFLPLFLPLSRVISSFTFLVSTSSSHPPSRAPLTAFSRFPTLIYLDLDPLSILSVYVGMHARRTPWEFVLGRAFNDTSEKFWGREREREEEEPCSIAFFSFRGSPLRREQRPWEIFNRRVASSARNFFSAQNYALGPCIMYIFVRWGEGARSSPGRKYSKGAWWCTILLLSRQ